MSAKISQMRVLITGGAGFIGSHLVDRFLAEGAAVTALDNLSSGRKDNLRHNFASSAFQFVQGDVLDSSLMDRLIASHDLICHLAAVVGVRRVLDRPLDTILQNYGGTQTVLAVAHKHGRRVLFASTSEVYGKSRELPFREDGDRVLGGTGISRWAYATGKALDEHLCFAYHSKGLPMSVVRYFNAYGPRMDVEGYAGVVASFITCALAGEPLVVHHDGSQTRALTYINDTVEGSFLAAVRPEAIGQVLNIGSVSETSILELAHLVRKLTSSPSDIVFVPYDEAYGDQFEDPLRRVPDVSKAARLLGFRACVPLPEGLERTVHWFRGL